MGPKVLWRKLQKKLKRKKYARCSRCGGFATMERPWPEGMSRLLKRCRDCGHSVEYRWSAELGRVAERQTHELKP